MRNPRRTLGLVAGLSLAIVVLTGSACRRVLDGFLTPVRKLDLPLVSRQAAGGSPSSSRAGMKVVRRAIAAYGGTRAWQKREGLELRMIWKEYSGPRVDENPALIQLKYGFPPRIRIHFEKLDHVYGLGDQGAWVMIRNQPDRNAEFVAQARFTCTMMAFLLSLPFSLAQPGVVVQSVEVQQYAGMSYDVVTVGFTGSGHPWPDDSLQLWFRQTNSLLERCVLFSTAENSGFGPPPNRILIQWLDHSMKTGVPLARTWSYFRLSDDGTRNEKMFDIEIAVDRGVEKAETYRLFMDVLFREPKTVPPPSRSPDLAPASPSPARPPAR